MCVQVACCLKLHINLYSVSHIFLRPEVSENFPQWLGILNVLPLNKGQFWEGITLGYAPVG